MCRGDHGASTDSDRDTDRVIGCSGGFACFDLERFDLSVVAVPVPVPVPVSEDERTELSSSRERVRREFNTYGCGMAPTVVACR